MSHCRAIKTVTLKTQTFPKKAKEVEFVNKQIIMQM
jgi:hypothetical protein